jgi:hypothetical protein
VHFNSTPASSFTVVSSTKITAVSPPLSAGVVNVTVTTPGGTSAVSPADHFAFTASAPSPTVPVPSTGALPPSPPLLPFGGLVLLGLGMVALSTGVRTSLTRGRHVDLPENGTDESGIAASS